MPGPAIALAAGGATTSPRALVLLALVGTAYVLAHLVTDRLRRRFLVSTGFEYIALGSLLGPVWLVTIQPLGDLDSLGPVLAFAAGWAGLLLGLSARRDDRGGLANRLALSQTVVVGIPVGVVAWFLLGPLARDATDRDVAAGFLATAAVAGSAAPIEVLKARYPALTSDTLELLRNAMRLSSLYAVLGFGLLFCWHHAGDTRLIDPPGPGDWVVITAAIGAVLGGVFGRSLGDGLDDDQTFLALSGIVVFASGAAFFLNLSPLTVNLLLGATLLYAGRARELPVALEGSRAPVGILLLVFAGALWRPVPFWPAVGLAAAVFVLSSLGRFAAGAIAAPGTVLRADIGRGLLGQGETAVAMAVSLRLVYEGPAVNLAFTAALVAVLLGELLAPRVLRGLLVDSGDLRTEHINPTPVPTSR